MTSKFCFGTFHQACLKLCLRADKRFKPSMHVVTIAWLVLFSRKVGRARQYKNGLTCRLTFYALLLYKTVYLTSAREQCSQSTTVRGPVSGVDWIYSMCKLCTTSPEKGSLYNP